MKAKDARRFDIALLRELAGAKVFARGEAYYRDGQVEILSMGPDRVLARVAGSEDYRVELTGRDAHIDGECSCPAFEDWGFCKHMVATALAANAVRVDAEAAGAGTFARIRDYLKQKGLEALVDMLMDVAERDAALFRKLELATVAVDVDDKAFEARLRKVVDSATRIRGFVDYAEAGGWAKGVAEALDALAGLASGKHAGLVVELAEHAIDRIEKAIGSIDDSDGHCTGLLERARDIHVGAACVARPDPIALARDLFARELADEYDTFYDAAPLYAEALGEKGLQEYRRLAAEAWEKLPPRKPGGKRDEFSNDYRQLARILDFFAERAGDVEARVVLRAKDLSSPLRYLQLAEFCLAQRRPDEALRRAQEGLWMFEDDRPDEPLLLFVVKLLSKAGRKEDAAAHLWRAFGKAPSLELYARLCKLGGKAARASAIDQLHERLAKEKRSQWYYPADLLVSILTQEKMYDAAWTVVRQHQASRGVGKALARASEASHPQEAVEVYTAHVNDLINTGGNPAYAEAVKIIARMAPLRRAGDHAAYLAGLKVRFGRKRNLMKLLG